MYQREGFETIEELGRVLLLFIFFGLSMLPVNYLMSFLFKTPSGGCTSMILLNLLTGIGLFAISFVMKGLSEDARIAADVLRYIFMVFPQFALCDGVYNLNTVFVMGVANKEESSSFYSWTTGISANLTYMIVIGICSMIGLIMVETRDLRKNDNKLVAISEVGFVDEDVQAEKNRVDNMTYSEISSKNLVVQKVSKNYGEVQAVNKISFSVEQSECFSLLGISGAGKTSTIKMLTNDEKLSQGDAWVSFDSIGYCPQLDVLNDNLTGSETLRLYSLLRGVPNKNIDSICNDLAENLNLKKDFKKQVHKYSDSTKRKLSTAIALIGNPSVIYLDEPTTGFDPVSKRLLRDLISKERISGKSIILSTESIDDCEALTTRLAVMVNGEFKCLGTPQYLKNKFSEGHTIMVRLGKCDQLVESKKITEYLRENFPDVYLR